jgi:hypothetical protein
MFGLFRVWASAAGGEAAVDAATPSALDRLMNTVRWQAAEAVRADASRARAARRERLLTMSLDDALAPFRPEFRTFLSGFGTVAELDVLDALQAGVDAEAVRRAAGRRSGLLSEALRVALDRVDRPGGREAVAQAARAALKRDALSRFRLHMAERVDDPALRERLGA